MHQTRTLMFAAIVLGTAQFSRAETPPAACPNPATWISLETGKETAASATAVIRDMVRRDVVLLGENHDNEDHHRWQLQALSALHAERPDMVIGFEMFPRRLQPVLDRWIEGKLPARQFLEESEWDKVWNVSADFYLPLFHFARINRIPMLALNVDEKLSKAIADKGWDAIPAREREGIGRPAPPTEAYREFLFKTYLHHSDLLGRDGKKAAKEDQAFRYFVESQTTWDRAMAEALARRITAGPANERPLVVGIMGSGHIRFGYGVPHQLRDLGIRNIGSLLPVSTESHCRDLRAGLADAVFVIPQAALGQPETPRLGVRLDQDEEGVRIVEVVADSLAEKTGLKAGDRLLEVGGAAPKKVSSVVAAVRQQPGGSWLPLRIRRGAETLELVVKFPPAKS